MLSVQVICVGKLKESFYIDAVKEYAKRLGPYCSLTIDELPEERLPADPSSGEIQSALKKEAVRIRGRIPSGAAVIALCVEGDMLSSPALAERIGRYAGSGVSRLCFLIGGSCGLDEDLKRSADLRLSLSAMTFPHHLARVMLVEQLYRAFQIRAGTRYHK